MLLMLAKTTAAHKTDINFFQCFSKSTIIFIILSFSLFLQEMSRVRMPPGSNAQTRQGRLDIWFAGKRWQNLLYRLFFGNAMIQLFKFSLFLPAACKFTLAGYVILVLNKGVITTWDWTLYGKHWLPRAMSQADAPVVRGVYYGSVGRPDNQPEEAKEVLKAKPSC